MSRGSTVFDVKVRVKSADLGPLYELLNSAGFGLHVSGMEIGRHNSPDGMLMPNAGDVQARLEHPAKKQGAAKAKKSAKKPKMTNDRRSAAAKALGLPSVRDRIIARIENVSDFELRDLVKHMKENEPDLRYETVTYHMRTMIDQGFIKRVGGGAYKRTKKPFATAKETKDISNGS